MAKTASMYGTVMTLGMGVVAPPAPPPADGNVDVDVDVVVAAGTVVAGATVVVTATAAVVPDADAGGVPIVVGEAARWAGEPHPAAVATRTVHSAIPKRLIALHALSRRTEQPTRPKIRGRCGC
ncbi:MAG: hypothetical protein ACYDEN_14685 [Acidimicrobiales bacterium]